MPKTLAPLHTFKPGRYVALNGEVVELSEADMVEAADSYDPALCRAPLVIGHPKLDAPAYGWVESFKADKGYLFATPEKDTVNQEFAELVEQKLYRAISVSFWGRNAPGNPKPGKLYPKHVGFLGAVPPAVKGLPEPQVVSFAGSQEGVLEFGEWDDITNAQMWRRMREWLIEKFGAEVADRVCPTWDVTSLERGAEDELRQAQDAAIPSFADPVSTPPTTPVNQDKGRPVPAPQDDPAKLKEQLAQAQRELAESKAKEAKARNDAIHAENLSFAEGLVAAAKWPKAHADVLVATLDTVAQAQASAGAVLEFAQGETKAPVLATFRSALGALAATVEFAEMATRTDAASTAGTSTLEFANPDGDRIDQARMTLHRKVKAYQARHAGTSYEAALSAVQAGLA